MPLGLISKTIVTDLHRDVRGHGYEFTPVPQSRLHFHQLWVFGLARYVFIEGLSLLTAGLDCGSGLHFRADCTHASALAHSRATIGDSQGHDSGPRSWGFICINHGPLVSASVLSKLIVTDCHWQLSGPRLWVDICAPTVASFTSIVGILFDVVSLYSLAAIEVEPRSRLP